MVTWSWKGFDGPLLNHVLTTLSVPKHISLLSAHTCTLILRCTNTVKGVWASVRDTLGISVSLSFLLWAHKVQTHTDTYTYLGRLGCGEVKPGRDKVMLRHLGPVFPVSGSRHQTSWPGSTKRFFLIQCATESTETRLSDVELNPISLWLHVIPFMCFQAKESYSQLKTWM